MMMTFDLESLSTFIAAFFALAGFAATLSVLGFALALPRRRLRASDETQAAPAAVRPRVLEGAGARS